MSNEEVAVLAQSGNEKSVLLLWERVKYFAKKQAGRWIRSWEGRGGVVLDDLMQASFLALLDALESWKPDGGSFIGWYALMLKAAFTVAYGQRTKRDRMDPLQTATSLETPLDGDDDDLTLWETVPDPAAEAAFESVEDRGRREAVETLLSCLSNQQREVIRARYWQGLTLEQVGQQIGMSRNGAAQLEKKALRVLRHPANRSQLMKCL